MSGTSLDGVDGVLIDLTPGQAPRLRGHRHEPFVAALRDELMALNTSGANEIDRAAQAARGVAMAYSSVVGALMFDCGISASEVRAIGAHGQTVRHRPEAGYTVQLLDGSLLAELTRIDVVSDLRSRDVAAGGQGAPLAPGFHAAVFGHPDEARAVLNLGGIANLTLLAPGQPVLGFDTGPANVLLDAWCQQQIGQTFDAGGAWAAGGECLPGLLAQLLGNRYFSQRPPKSTGRDTFSLDWLANQVAPYADAVAQDIQATLTELTASACAESVRSYANDSKLLVVCGGGAFNTCLMQRLQAHLPAVQVITSDAFGLHPLQVEAAAFAWLAQQTMARRPGNLPSVTGAAGPRILGAIYPA